MDDFSTGADEVKTDDGKAQGRMPPYISFKTLLTFLEDQQQHGVPMQIDRSVLTRFSGSVGGQLIAALKFLDLIGQDQSVKPKLQTLVQAYGTEGWQKELRELVERSYAPLVQHDLSRVTPAQFHELFKNQYPAKDAVVRKCEVFFLNAAKAADIPVNPRIAKHRAPKSPNGRRQSEKPPSGRHDAAQKPDTKPEDQKKPPSHEPPPQSHYQMLISILDPVQMDEDEQEAVWTLIRYLKRIE